MKSVRRFDEFRWNPSNYRHRCDVFRDHSSSRDDSAAPHGHASGDDRPGADPDLIFNDDRLNDVPPPLPWFKNQAVADRFKADIGTDLDVASDADTFAWHAKAGVAVDKAPRTDGYVSKPAQRPHHDGSPNETFALNAHSAKRI